MSADTRVNIETESPPPSYFAGLGQPMCSKWAKSEVEWIALEPSVLNSLDLYVKNLRKETV